MPYIPNTPESSLRRSDSRDPKTTCQGITCSGKSCKRSIPSPESARASTTGSSTAKAEAKAERFCWQHKGQAQSSKVPTLSSKTSYDTLLERLQVLNLGHQPDSSYREPKRTLNHNRQTNRQEGRAVHSPRPWASPLLCCFLGGEDSHQLKVVRYRKRPYRRASPEATLEKASLSEPLGTRGVPRELAGADGVIPKSLPSDVRSQLLQELCKPISEFDEAGYIYMYRKVVESGASPKDDVALGEPSPGPMGQRMSRYSGSAKFPEPTKEQQECGKILIKIGYTTNVQNRLSAWSGKCGAKVELLRFYPHASSRSGANEPRKAPNCHRIERLIHIELADKRVRQNCSCGSVHREWFEIEASAHAVRAVDEVIRRWVSWAERGPHIQRGIRAGVR